MKKTRNCVTSHKYSSARHPELPGTPYLFCSAKHVNRKKKASVHDSNTGGDKKVNFVTRMAGWKAGVGTTVGSAGYFSNSDGGLSKKRPTPFRI